MIYKSGMVIFLSASVSNTQFIQLTQWRTKVADLIDFLLRAAAYIHRRLFCVFVLCASRCGLEIDIDR
jgi:hypothetical protein